MDKYLQFEGFPGKDKFARTEIWLPNPLDPRTARQENYTLIQPEKAPASGTARLVRYSAYIPPKLLDKYLTWLSATFSGMTEIASSTKRFPVNLTLFFGAPGDMLPVDTLGLRYFLQHVDDTFVIVIPNFEEHGESKDEEPKNAGITTAIIRKIITEFNMKPYPLFDFKVTCVTAYSAGYGGMIQSINNELFPLKDLKKMVFYDCLYRTDGPPLPKGEKIPALLPTEQNNGPDEVDQNGHPRSAYNTRRAITKVQQLNSDLEVIAYCVTGGGSPKYLEGSQKYTVTVDKLIDLRPTKLSPNSSWYLLALTITRILIAAKDENRVNVSDIPQAFMDLHTTLLPARGQIASVGTQLKQSKTGFRPNTTLQAWGDLNKSLIDKAKPHFDEAIKLVTLNQLFYYGYPNLATKEKPAGPQAGMLHIAQIFEFAGEEFI